MGKKSAKNKGEGKEKLFGAQGFEEYYSQLYGDRWQALKEAFTGRSSAVEYHVTGAEESYFLDSASVLAALCLPLAGAGNILDLCAAPGGKTLVLASRMEPEAKLSSNERSPERKHRLATVVQTCLPQEISEKALVLKDLHRLQRAGRGQAHSVRHISRRHNPWVNAK